MINERKAYVIYNSNPNRLCYYEDADGNRHVPEWLRGDFAHAFTPPNSPLHTTNDLTDALFMFEQYYDQVKEMAETATKCYGYEGAWFTQAGARYPDSCTTVEDYEKVAPKFIVREVVFSVMLIEE